MKESKIFTEEFKRYREACLRVLKKEYSMVPREDDFVFIHTSQEYFKASKTPEEVCREYVKQLRE